MVSKSLPFRAYRHFRGRRADGRRFSDIGTGLPDLPRRIFFAKIAPAVPECFTMELDTTEMSAHPGL